METISQRKSAGRSGDGKHRNTRPESRRIGNERPENRRGAQPTEAVEKMDAARGANSLAAMPTPSVEDARET
ncbi:MAG: hypothetical protein QW112_02835, partial [Candidatus Micrarchaeia archaeon]